VGLNLAAESIYFDLDFVPSPDPQPNFENADKRGFTQILNFSLRQSARENLYGYEGFQR